MREITESPEVVKFLESRGLDVQFAMSCGVKSLDPVTIAWPLWNGQWKMRNVLTKNMVVAKMGSTEKPMPAVFGDLWCDINQSLPFHVHLCEGETDALSMAQVLYTNRLPGMACAVPGVNGLGHAVRLLSPLLGQGTHFTMYPDPDQAGDSMAGAAAQLGAHVVRLPSGQDLCEFLGGLHFAHRWPALQLLRHHAATYVPFAAPEKPSPGTRPNKGSDVPDGVRDYFQRIVTEVVRDEHVGYSEVEKVCCPWHEDPNPSLSIDWTRCIWYCHGCGLGGGVKKWRELANEHRMMM